MEKPNLDTLDNEIIRLLTADGRIAIGEMAKKLNVTAPTVRKRIKVLEKSGIFKVSGLIDPSQHQEMITALVAMSVQSGGKLDQILDKIAHLPNVSWAGVATGRYDIIAEVICVEGKDELYRFTFLLMCEFVYDNFVIGFLYFADSFLLFFFNILFDCCPTNVGQTVRRFVRQFFNFVIYFVG